jgi:hypothetical protein
LLVGRSSTNKGADLLLQLYHYHNLITPTATSTDQSNQHSGQHAAAAAARCLAVSQQTD